MKIALCKSDNYANDYICKMLKKDDDVIKIINNSDFALGAIHLRELLSDSDVIINMMGVKFTKRWNKRRKEEIYYSRVENTKVLVKAINGMEKPPSLLFAMTLVNIYNNYDVHDEFSLNFNTDFLADMCKNWEKEAFKLTSKTRLCIFRTGLVLSDKIGFFPKIRRIYKFNLGGKISNGKQCVPYIHINDLLKAFRWCISIPHIQGIYNLVSPEVLTNEEFSYIISINYKRLRLFSYPKNFMNFLYGEASSVFTSGQFVVPQRLLSDGFEFDYPTLEKCLENL